jgi:hypothetical protein
MKTLLSDQPTSKPMQQAAVADTAHTLKNGAKILVDTLVSLA